MQTVPVTFRIDKRYVESIKRIALYQSLIENNDVSYTDVIRDALMSYIELNPYATLPVVTIGSSGLLPTNSSGTIGI